MIDQAQRLRELVLREQQADVPPLRPAGSRVIAVCSGKGGVGKSVICANLGLAAGRCRTKVLLVDADYGLANLDLILGVTPAFTLQHLLEGQVQAQDCLLKVNEYLSLLPGGSGVTRLADMDRSSRLRILGALQALERDAELTIIDIGAGIGRNAVQTAGCADEVLVVTTAEPTAITDAYAMIKVLHLSGRARPIRLLVNMAVSGEEARRVWQRIAGVCRRFLGVELALAGFLPMDAAVPLSIRQKLPLVADGAAGPACRALCGLAQQLVRDCRRGLDRAAGSQTGFFRRLADFFNPEGGGL